MRKNSLINKIFDIRDAGTFEILAIEIFQYQAANNPVYREYLKTLKVNVKKVKTLFQIPFLPIGFFKTHKVACGSASLTKSRIFTSSGTTGSAHSKHYISDPALYEKVLRKGFEYFYGNIQDYCILALLPSYAKNSSLVYMVNDLIEKSEHPDSGFYLEKTEELAGKLIISDRGIPAYAGMTDKREIPAHEGMTDKTKKKQKVLLFGVSFALLDLCSSDEVLKIRELTNNTLIVMETGGMKGRRKEMVREELHKMLCAQLSVAQIHSEYGMTELLSQAYSKGNGRFNSPPWMKVFIRDMTDPLTLTGNNKTGGINIIDLANINSCAFIASQDLGKVHEDGSFEVLGRFDDSDIRGCNLIV